MRGNHVRHVAVVIFVKAHLDEHDAVHTLGLAVGEQLLRCETGRGHGLLLVARGQRILFGVRRPHMHMGIDGIAGGSVQGGAAGEGQAKRGPGKGGEKLTAVGRGGAHDRLGWRGERRCYVKARRNLLWNSSACSTWSSSTYSSTVCARSML